MSSSSYWRQMIRGIGSTDTAPDHGSAIGQSKGSPNGSTTSPIGDVRPAAGYQNDRYSEQGRQSGMTPDLVTPENLNRDLLYAIFEAALMEVRLDTDGGIKVTDSISCFVVPRDDTIRLMTLFRFRPEVSHVTKLDFVNKVNDEYVVVRASVTKQGYLCFDYDVPVRGGITRRAIVEATRLFLRVPAPAIREHGENLVL
jgi:hypothetical protein